MNSKYLLAIMVVVCITGCARQMVMPVTAEVQFLSSNDGAITLASNGYGKNQQEAITNAELNAIDALLFRGIPASEQSTALIGTNEVEIRNTHSKYFAEFYSNMRYKTFVTSIYHVNKITKPNRGIISVPTEITINIRSLRADLEQRGVIRKFGY